MDADFLDTEAFMDKESSMLRRNKATLPDLLPLLENKLKDLKAKADNSDVESVSIYQDDNADAVEYIGVENKSGSLLPFTGGIGSMIFYVVGGALVIGACILLITHLRVSGKKEEK